MQSQWCMEEFQVAYQKMVGGNKKYLIAVLLEDLTGVNIPQELDNYLKVYSYIDAR